ncbi:ABC transporter permease [Parasutterella sp.]|uniref:ABC transporter permease n=1 Tax=Parasutterella sp. TaxID=2049037 RepID=UPI003521BE73
MSVKSNNKGRSKGGEADIISSLKNIKLPFYIAWFDIRQRYRRSSLGPFWITISTGVLIGTIGIVFGTLYKAPVEIFLPYLCTGYIIWGLISSVIVQSTDVYCQSENMVKQLSLPLFTYILTMIAKCLYIFAHNLVILPVVFLIVGKPINWNFLLVIPGFFLLLLNFCWMSLILSIVCTRFRDMRQIIVSGLQVFFYLTPIVWMPSLLPEKSATLIVEPNPFYHLLEIVRAPLLGLAPSALNWCYSLVLAILGTAIGLAFFNKYRTRIAYWL